MAKKQSASKNQERLFLLDGMALAYRSYFAFISRPLINSKGENTSAIYGFVTTLMKIIEDEQPDHIAVVFDTREPTFRHKMYKPYKATREKMPEDMSAQMDKLKEVVTAFNVPLLELPGYEADDIMGTLAKKAEKQKMRTYLVTGDKDFMQLISPSTVIYRPGKQGNEAEVLDEKAVYEKFGVTPEFVIDVLGLTGDSSDNVPGVPGIGEKTAIPLVQKFGTIESIYKNIENISQQGLRQKLITNKDQALLSKTLVTIDTRVPVKADIHHLTRKPPNHSALIKLFTELEFRSLARKLTDSAPSIEQSKEEIESPEERINITSDKHNYHLISTEKEFLDFAERLKKSKLFVFDTETTGKDPLRAELVGLSFAFKEREAWYIPITDSCEEIFSQEETHIEGELAFQQQHKPENRKKTISSATIRQGLSSHYVLEHLSPVFANSAIKKAGQNIKYDMLILATHGVRTEGIIFDTMVAHYLLRSDSQHNLDALAAEYLNYTMISFDDLTGTGKDRKDIREVDVKAIAEYSSEDADMTFRLYNILSKKLREEKLFTLYNEIELPLIQVLADMELAGICLDIQFLKTLSGELEEFISSLTKEIFALAGGIFNINSTQQLAKILFETLKLTAIRKTKTGYSTDVGVLEALRHEHPIVEKLLEYRQMQKLHSTYVDALPELLHPKTKRIHTSFNQTVAATGRLSSSDPNLQNIPIRTEIGRSIRKAFIPSRKNSVILSADYSQIELRIMAHMSGDKGLIDAFAQGEDIHATTASKVFGVALKDVTKDMRRKAKEVNFGIMYGIGPFGLSTRLDITQSEAKEIITKYFERFPGVKVYIISTIAKAKEDGYVSTMLGRRRYLPDLRSGNFAVRSNAERQAINMPIQGTAADMIKIAMIRIHTRFGKENIEGAMLLQVHDELVFEVTSHDKQRAITMIAEEMKQALSLAAPLEVEIGSGKNWYDAH